MTEKKRIYWIDITKAICIFAVIIGHQGFDSAGFVYSFHLTVFFILAGYTSKVKELNGNLLKQWFNQLMKPYFLTCFAVLSMELINLIVISKQASIASVTSLIATDLKRFFFASGGIMQFGSIDMGRFIGAIWFLPAMFFARIIFQLIINKVADKRIQIIIAVGVAAIAVMLSNVAWLPFSLLPGMFAVPFILSGYYAKEYGLFEKMKPLHYIGCGAIFIVGCLTPYAQRLYMVNVYAMDYFLTPVFALAGSVAIIGISMLLEKIPTKAFRFFGENSLIVLCIHLVEMNTGKAYYQKVIALLNLPNTKLVSLLLELIVVILLSVVIVWIKRRLEKKAVVAVAEGKRDLTIDIMRAFLIVLMLVCHVATSQIFHRIVYSFHMIAFVFVSGYFYKFGLPIKVQLKKCLKSLGYYGIFAVFYLFVSSKTLPEILKTLVGGISYTNKLFTSFSSVGPIYFILMLFAVRLLYLLVDYFFKGYKRDVAVLIIALVGILLGKTGYWLFWSFDCAMFCLVFFHMATYFRKYNLLNKLCEMPYLYFIFSLCWFMFVHQGSMDLATRRYENIGILIIGSISAFILVYQLCSYIMRHWPSFITKAIASIGSSTVYILIFHTLFSAKVSAFASNVLGLSQTHIFHLGASTFIQVAVGTAVFCVVQYIGNKIKATKKST